jgi:hypothetical protein
MVWTKGDLIKISETITEKKLTVNANTRVFKRLHQDYGLGTLSGSQLKLSIRDRTILKTILEQSGTTDFNLSRIELAQQGYKNSEKDSKVKPFDGYCDFSSPSGAININNKRYLLPASAAMTLDYRSISSIEHDIVIIVENADIFLKRLIRLKDYKNPLLMYRGHDMKARWVKAFAADFCTKLPVAIACDLDFKGLSFGEEFGLPCALPKLDVAESLLKKLPHRATLYDKQFAYHRNDTAWHKMLNTHKTCALQQDFFDEALELAEVFQTNQ